VLQIPVVPGVKGRYNPPVDAMSESKLRELPGAAAAADKESRTEGLLVEGLDHYFEGRFDEAIHLWTRVLFIDRTHARARAYISRARTAQSERLRRAEEMLHAAGDLLDRGELRQARGLLANAEQASGADEKVAELWAKLERVERTRHVPAAIAPAAVADARPRRTWRWTIRVGAQFVAIAACAVFVVTLVGSPVVGEWVSGRSVNGTVVDAGGTQPLEVLSSEDAAVVRARHLYARGRLAEALAVLDRITTDSTNREAVDQLRIEIQRWLLLPRLDSTTTVPAGGGVP
jgi:tetratricopeptide (TPR) repeat protein